MGEEVVELNRIGALSGMDGIVSVLNQQVKVETGEEGTFTNVSRAVKYVYDRIQEAYDGTYDSEQGSVVGQRRSFFTPEEVLALAREAQAARGTPA